MEEGEDFEAGLNGYKHRNPDVYVFGCVLDVDLCSQITSYTSGGLSTPGSLPGQTMSPPVFPYPSPRHTPHFDPSWNLPSSNSPACLLQPVTTFRKQTGGNHHHQS
uniref:Uncharacterized protein n=1 Tax=Setaria digitata TaxID=48799 RepID=A0A915Q556_9BILA